MANEFIIKNGFRSKGDSQITGSLGVSGSLQIQGIADVSASIAAAGGGSGDGFPFTGDAVITGSLLISASHTSQSLSVIGSGSTLFDVVGSQGSMLTVEDSNGSSTMLTALGKVKISGSSGVGALTIESTDPFIEGAIPDKTGNNKPLELKSSLPNGTGSYSGNYTSLKLKAADISYGINARGTSIEIHAGDNLIKDPVVSESRGGNVLIESGKSSGTKDSGDVIIAAIHSSQKKGNIELKGGEIQIFSGSIVFQDKGVNWTNPDIENVITTIPTSNQQATGSNPLYIKPGTNGGSDGMGAPLILEGGNSLGSQGGPGGNIEISAGTSSTTAYSNSISGSIILKGREININSPIVYDIPGVTNTTTWFDWGSEGGGSGKYVKLGVVTSSYNQSAQQQGVMIYTETSTPGTTAAAWSFTENDFTGLLAHSKVTAITGSFKYVTGASPLKIDVGTDNTSSLEIISNNFTLDTTGNITATNGTLTMNKTTTSETITSKVKSGTTGGDVLEIESSNLNLDTAGKLSSAELSATTGSYSLIKGNSTLRIDNGGDDIQIVSSNFNVSDTGEVSSGGSGGVTTTNITASSDISASGTIQGNHLRSNSLTSGNIVLAGTNGRLEGTTDLTYNTSNKLLSAPTASFDHLIVSQVISSSVINTSGSNIFGDEATDTQTLNGSVILGNIDSATETDALFIDSSNTVKKRTLQANAFTNTTIGTTTNALTVSTGLNLNSGTAFNGSAAKTISVDVSDFMTNGSNNRIVTATGTDAMNAEANLTFDGSSLGVGATTAPSYELDVFGSIAVQGVAFAAWNSNIIKLGDFDGNGAKLALYDNTSAEIVRLTGGNVGIGTTSPGEKLEVVGNISSSGFIKSDNSLRLGDEGDNGFLIISGSDSNNDERNSNIKFQRSLEFRSHGGSTDEILTLNYLGNVGIGKANAAEKLEVVGNISSSGFIKSDNSLRLGDEGDNGFLIISGSDSNNDERNSNIKFQRSLEFRSHGGSTDEILTLNYLGNVGIGKANAAEKLEVVGNISSSGNITGNSFVKGGGTSAQFLKADGSVDSTAYTTNTGTVTGVTGTAPIVSSGGTSPAISINAATNSAAGSMSAIDKGKIDAITVTSGVNLNTMNSSITSNTSAISGKAASGANNDITSLTGLTTALSVAQGGTGATTLGAFLMAANDLSELNDPGTARENLELGSIATQANTNVNIDGGSITGITDLAVADGGTGASNASTARTNLGAAASGANTDITSIIDENLKVGGDVSETTENYINFTSGKIALTQGLNLVVHGGANLYPGTTNSMNLGTSAYMWADAYSRQFISDASTTSTPAFVVDKDETNTGFYYKGTNQLAVTIGGNEIGYFNASGLQVTKTSATSQFSGHLQAHCLGIGTAPSTTLGEIRAAGDVVANYSSDKRLKENIKPISGALDKLLQISGVTFDWIEKEEIHSHKGHDVGVIAQEVEEVLPEVVVTRDNGYKAVNYEKIVPLLIESIKDLKAEIDELKKSK